MEPRKRSATSQQPGRARHLRTPSAPTLSQQPARSLQAQGPQAPARPQAPRTGAGSGTGASRPAFTTLQQHFSPAKSTAPKPRTSTFLAPPTPSRRPGNVAAAAETSRHQTELLQLHLLHGDAGPAEAQWRASARRQLGQRFGQLGAQWREVRRADEARAAARNACALRGWATEDRVQALDEVVSGLWAVSHPGGRHTRLVRLFRDWVDGVGDVEAARRDGDGSVALFVGDLDASWKEECAGLARRLDAWRRQLQGLARPVTGDDEGPPSSLARMLEGARCMVRDMRAEVDVMEQVEREALAREEAWIEEMHRQLDDEDDDGDGLDGLAAGAVWRAM